jgi:hypothetical protein
LLILYLCIVSKKAFQRFLYNIVFL